MKKLLLLLPFLLSFRFVQAQLSLPAYATAMAYSQLNNDVFSFGANQAALTDIHRPTAGIIAERRFMLADFQYYNAALAVPSSLGHFGLQVQYNGFKNFTQNNIGLAYAKKLGQKVSAGIQFNYYGYKIPAYNNASTISFEAALRLKLTDKLTGGLQVTNPIGGKLGKNNSPILQQEKLPAIYSIGLGYDASENFFTSIQIIKQEDMQVNVVAGFQYQFARQFFIRAGIKTEASSAYAGAGIKLKNFRIDITTSYHPQLGLSPGIMFISEFGKQKTSE